jgi:hypothetical protein
MIISQALQVSLDLLFVSGGLAAIAAMVSTWNAARPAIAALRTEWTETGNHRDFRYSVTVVSARADRTPARIAAPKAAHLTLTRRFAPVRQKQVQRAAA